MKNGTRWAALAVMAVLLGACSGESEDASFSEEALLSLTTGAGAGVPVWGVDPCEFPHAFAQNNGFNYIEAKPGEHVIHGTPGKDLIVGTDGDDHIWGGAGADIICAGYGEDVVHGDNRDDGSPNNDANDGPDYIDGGGDNDTLYGDGCNDVIHGRAGSDDLWGGDGDDILLGDILDDNLYGEDGDDLLIGGHGTDTLNGGKGNDFLRGDTGNDTFIGGAGSDVASFITAMPPGQGQKVGSPPNTINGVKVDFSVTGKCDAPFLDGKSRHDGCANGDGGNEPIDGVETVIGSPYDDIFLGANGGPHFMGGYGNDKCDGKACGQGVAAGTIFVAVHSTPRDTGVTVMGTSGSDQLEIYPKGQKLIVHVTNNVPIAAQAPCQAVGQTVTCPLAHTLRFLAVWLGDGGDIAKFGSQVAGSDAFPRDITVHASGDDGSDWLHGGDEQDVFFSGPTGEDHLFGNAGSDALLSESRKWPAMDCSKLTKDQQDHNPRCYEDKPDGAAYTDGADELSGGPGDDQLVTDYPCGGHTNSGGPGRDIAGFARSGHFDLTAQLAGASTVTKAFHAHAYNPQLCGLAKATRFEDDLEILEAADGNDELWGNDKPNTIWGREGNDAVHGLGGDDDLEGTQGYDWLYGGAGNNVFKGGEEVFDNAD